MITISCPMKQEFIIELLDKKTIGSTTFMYKGKKGINMEFSIDGDDREEAIKIAKEEIKSTDVGKVLYFQVT